MSQNLSLPVEQIELLKAYFKNKASYGGEISLNGEDVLAAFYVVIDFIESQDLSIKLYTDVDKPSI